MIDLIRRIGEAIGRAVFAVVAALEGEGDHGAQDFEVVRPGDAKWPYPMHDGGKNQ